MPFDAASLDPAIAKGLERAVAVAFDTLQDNAAHSAELVDGWRIPPALLGQYGTNYALRGLIALIAFGANLPADAVYPTAFVDAKGDALTGAKRYVLHFPPDQTPPVKAFWSVTLYDEQSFFVANPIDRCAISSWMPLQRNDDGSIDLCIQHDSPGKEREANWLPCPRAAFNLTLRMYWPSEQVPSILDGSWAPPGVTAVDGA